MECMEKMLNIGIEVQQCHVHVSMLLVQATAHSVYEDLSESDDNVQPISASTGCFSRFAKIYNFLNIKMTGRLQWYGHVKKMPENTKINYGLDTTEEKEKRMSKKNVDGRSTSSHDKKFRTRSMEKQRGMMFGFWKMATSVKNQIDKMTGEAASADTVAVTYYVE